MGVETSRACGRNIASMRITKSQLKQIIKEELAEMTDPAYTEYENMYAPNEAAELRELYQIFKSHLPEITSEMVSLDEQIIDKIEQIERRLNELAK